MNEKKTSPAQIKAAAKYSQKTYDRVGVYFHKGERETIQAHAARRDESTNAFIVRAVHETMKRDDDEQ